MRLVTLEAVNYGAIEHLDLGLAPLTLVCAPNGWGKSLLCEAVEFCLTGDPGRAENKKGLPELVRRGAGEGSVTVSFLDKQCQRDVASGKLLTADPRLPPALPFVLRASRFAALPSTERRNFLFSLMGLSLGPEEIVKRLSGCGISEQRIASVAHLLAGGFAPALNEANKQARDAKGRWHEVTGETWGKVKGKTWLSPVPEYDAEELAKLREYVKGWEAEVGIQNQRVGQLDERNAQKSQVPGLREQGQHHAKWSGEVKRLEREVTHLKTELEKLPNPDEGSQASLIPETPKAHGRRPSPQTLLACPECASVLVLEAGALVVAPPPQPAPEASAEAQAPLSPEPDERVALRARRSQLEKDLRDRRRELETAKNKVADCDAAIARANQLDALEIPKELTEAPAKLSKAQTELDGCRESVRELEDAERQAGAAMAKTNRASDLHADIESWESLAAALSPEGVPADILRDALKPLQDKLDAAAHDTGWSGVRITPDMGVTVGNFGYRLVSESIRWRADAMLAVAIAQISGIGLVTLDRFDVLDPDSRPKALAWFWNLANNGGLDSVLLFGTLKAPMPDGQGFICHWIGPEIENTKAA